MNKIFYQFNQTEDEDHLHFMYLNPVNGDGSDTHERVDTYNQPGEASWYDMEEFNQSFADQILTFKLEFIYE